MRDATTQHPTAATPVDESAGRDPRPKARFARRLLGYRRASVDAWAADLEASNEDLEQQAMELREELASVSEHSSELALDLRRARAELRYWNDRSSYIESEVARARTAALELENGARERAERVELEAQERSLQLVDRVCAEANALLVHAREEAREMFLRFETEVDMSQQKLDRLDRVRRDIASTMQSALSTFGDAVQELDRVAPAQQLVERLERPERRAGRTSGQQLTGAAARRFLQQREATTVASLSSPLPKVLAASVFDADERTKATSMQLPSAGSMPSLGELAMGDAETFALLAEQPVT